MNLEEITVQDCIDMYEKKRRYAIIENGKVTGFRNEKDATTDSKSE